MTYKTLVTAFTLLSSSLFGLNGFFPIGYGAASKGMGGVGVAYPQDSLVSAINPAGMAYLGNRVDLGFGWIGWDGSVCRSKSTDPSLNGKFSSSESAWYPELGANYLICPDISIGLAYILNGVFDVDYGKTIPFVGTSSVDATYRQYAIIPSISWAVDDCHAIGASLLITYGTVHFNGFQGLESRSKTPDHVTNLGDDTEWGLGVRLGWYGCLFNVVGLGATLQTPVWTAKFSKYRGIISDGGNFDTPARAAGGLAINPLDGFIAAFDFGYIFWRNTEGFDNNPLSNKPFGSKSGPGLGWDSQWFIKLGAAYDLTDAFTVRIGYNWGEDPIDGDAVVPNVATLATIEHHLTLGLTFRAGCNDFTFAYNHGFCSRVGGPLSAAELGGHQTLKNRQDHVTLAYGRLF